MTWSKEAIVALVTVFVMVLFSSLGMIWKHRSILWSLSLLRPGRQNVPFQDVELVSQHAFAYTDWVDMTAARKYQQETYTSLLRMRRGPRYARTSPRL
ncbi:hypothetical protein BKA63DRAFT_405404 [Paraphoma chrysanthemicola]|nr:hypothetical protein BKA63DRAFT_405404 [Paraphoma chrysanthemicola]